jgi:hypothetical protein
MNTKQNKIKLFLNLEDINKPKIEITETQDKDIKIKKKNKTN